MLDYFDIGKDSKGVVVLLHGFCESKEIWGDLPSLLAEEGYKCRAMDLPGFGLRHHNDLQPSINYFAQKVYETLQDIPQNVLMIGHSLGGYVTLAFAELFPEKLSGVCLFHSTAYADSEEKKANRNKTIEFIRKNGLDEFLPQLFNGLIAPQNAFLLKNKLELVITQARLTTQVEGAINAILAMRDRPERLSVLQKLSKPIFWIAGDADSVTPLQSIEEQVKQLPSAKLHIMHNVGHLGMIENPDLAFQILKDIVSSIK
ncbi:MAG: alpha/beta hydrolase [Cytophagales bacterium]|nr:alpha/beta hydrolase [Cytophagales bacterium]MDW8384244.1 alpha/beta hydrolase [Flammeovirgaceae bacterium]